MKTYQEFCAAIAKQLFDLIEKEGSLLSWRKNWNSAGSAKLPVGVGGMYRGSNLLALFFSQYEEGFKSNQWFTFNQIKQRDGQVKKGTKGRKVCFWKLFEKASVENNEKAKSIPLFKTYYVFNVDQTTLDETIEAAPLFSSADVDCLIQKLGITISHFGGKSYYNPNSDVIVLPEQKNFTSENAYYAVLLHELVHWTAGRDRLPRECFNNYGKSDKDRAQEELIAEVGSLFLSSHFGLQAELENHASYVQGWKKHLFEKEIMGVVNKATKAFEWILDRAFVIEIEETAG